MICRHEYEYHTPDTDFGHDNSPKPKHEDTALYMYIWLIYISIHSVYVKERDLNELIYRTISFGQQEA